MLIIYIIIYIFIASELLLIMLRLSVSECVASYDPGLSPGQALTYSRTYVLAAKCWSFASYW